MFKYASFVLTDNNEYYLENSNSHNSIIDHYHLPDNDVKIIKITFLSPADRIDIKDANKWTFIVNQTRYPDWTFETDSSLKDRARKALTRKINIEKIGCTIECGDLKTIKVGYGSIVNAGNDCNILTEDYGIVYAGKNSVATVGNLGFVNVGDNGTAISGNCGTSISTIDGTSITGNYGKSISGWGGVAIVGDYGIAEACVSGTAIAGERGRAIVRKHGKAKAGINGTIFIDYFDCNKLRVMIGYVGEDGIEPDTFYKVENCKLVKVEEKE